MTKLYCPICDSSTECALDGQQPVDRIVFFPDPITHAYIRMRACEKCGNKFNTYEISESTFEELRKSSVGVKEVRREGNKENYKATLVQRQLAKAADDLLLSLTPREQKILRMTFGVGFSKAYKVPEICMGFGISQNQLQNIQDKALRKLRHPARTEKIRIFLDPKYKREINSNVPVKKLLAAIFGEQL